MELKKNPNKAPDIRLHKEPPMRKSDLDLFACPSCKSESLTQGVSGACYCAKCDREFPQTDGIFDFRYLDKQYENIELRVEDEYDVSNAPADRFTRKQGSARIMANRLEKRIHAFGRQCDSFSVLDIGMFMANANGFRPFLSSVEPIIKTYVGIDPSPDIPANPSDIDEKINILRAYGEYLPVAANKFDLVVSIATFDHLFDADRCLSEIKRVIASDGLLYIVLNNEGSWFKRAFKNTAAHRQQLARRWHNYFWTAPEFRGLLAEHGFQVTDMHGYRFNPFFDNFNFGKAINENVKYAACVLSDTIGNAVAQDFGGNFAVVCRPT